MTSLSSTCLVVATWLAPWAGVGIVQLLTGRGLGTGVQPAFPFLALGLAAALWVRPRGDRWAAGSRDLRWLALALGWTVLGCAAAWRGDHMGLAGEFPWRKSLKQLALLVFFVGSGLLPSLVLGAAAKRERLGRRLERAVSGGLLLVSAVGLLQAVHFRFGLPGMEELNAWLRSNPSIASGSEELYLGHAFVGIPRVRSTFPEPLLFGSYLLAAVPIVAASAGYRQGPGRWWRAIAACAGALCLVLTFSRGAYLGALVILALAVVGMARGVLPRPHRRATALGLASATVILAAVAAGVTGRPPWELPALLFDRMAQSLATHDMSNLTRTMAWRVALQMTAEHPVAGAGWGSYGFHYFPLAGDAGSGAHFGWPVPNNFALLVAAETGLVGLLLWSRAFWPAFCGLFASGGSKGARDDVLRFGLATICAGVLVQGMTFSQWNLPHLWLLAGFSAWFGRRGWSVV